MKNTSLFLAGIVLCSTGFAQNPKTIVETACTTCHALSLITSAGHTPADWKLLVERMVAAGADVPKNQIPLVTDYLTKNYPEGNVPKAVIVPGPVKVSFKEWTVPTIGSRPHDPLATPMAPSGTPASMANVLGRIDPKTGEIKEYPPDDARFRPARPHRRQGRQHLVHGEFRRLHRQARSADRRVHRIQNAGPDARDPHTPLFDQEGILWFTVQNRQHGRPDQSHDRRNQGRRRCRRRSSNPYGMVFTRRATPSSANVRRQQDRQHRSARPWRSRSTRAGRGARPRRIAITNDDIIWYADYRPRLSGPARSQDRRNEGMALAQRAATRSLTASPCSKDAIWYIESDVQAEHAGAFRSQDREVPDLGHPVRRRRGAQHDDHPRR